MTATSRATSEELLFAVSSQLLGVLTRAGASMRNPDVEPPTALQEKGARFLEERIKADPQDPNEVEYVRRISLDDLSAEKWEILKQELSRLQSLTSLDTGLSNFLDKIPDEQIRRLIYMIMTFCNPRQRILVLHMYREAARTKSGSRVFFNTNDLLQALGYAKQEDGSFPSRCRSQLHRDLMALGSTKVYYNRPIQLGGRKRTKLMFRSIVRIRDVYLDNAPRKFDLVRAAEDGYGCADGYTVELEFIDDEDGGVVLFADSVVDVKQKAFAHTTDDYVTKLKIYLASRLSQKSLVDGKYLDLTIRSLFKNLDLVGKNGSRNKEILYRTRDELIKEGVLINAWELPGKHYPTNIRFHINPEKMRPG